ncbi:MAG: glutaredoxin family protein [Planctomycetes bacterium]|nr:glutaredoxin family protein [Planctomycetota bacterium]
MAVVIYGKDGCGFTKAACDDFARRGVPFQYVNVQADGDKLKELLRHTKGKRVVPVIVDDGKVTVGFNGTCGV